MAVYGFQLEVTGNAIKVSNGLTESFVKLERESDNLKRHIKGPFDTETKSIAHLEQQLNRLKTSQANSFRTDHIKKYNALIDQTEKKIAKLRGEEVGSKQGGKGMLGGLGGLIGGGLGLFSAFSFLKDSKADFDKLQSAITKVETALISTRHAAGLSLDELKGAGERLSGQVLFEEDAIHDAQSMLLTFTQVRGEIYNKTIPAVADFATRFKMELPEAANMLGKALNDPLKGMTRLQRQGVVFSDQQKATITKFMETNQIAKAQEVILTELNTEFGGLANAMTKTDAGKLKMAEKQLHEMKVSIGRLMSEGLLKLGPAIEGIGKLFHKAFGTEVSKDMENARVEMNVLFNTLKNSNIPIDERRDIMNRLNTEYGQYLPYVLTDKMTTEELAKAQSSSNQMMIEKIKIQVGLEVQQKMLDKYKSASKERVQAQMKFEEARLAPKDVEGAEKYHIGNKYVGKKEYHQIIAQENLAKSITNLDTAETELNKGLGMLQKAGFKGTTDIRGKGLSAIAEDVNSYFDKLKGKGLKGVNAPGAGGMAQNAINTSALGGASGGLGEAKVIKIDFHKALMEVNVPGGDGKDIIAKAPMSVEMMLRIINNLSQSQGSTM